MLESTKFEHLSEKIIAEFIHEEAIFTTAVGKECRLTTEVYCYYVLLFNYFIEGYKYPAYKLINIDLLFFVP